MTKVHYSGQRPFWVTTSSFAGTYNTDLNEQLWLVRSGLRIHAWSHPSNSSLQLSSLGCAWEGGRQTWIDGAEKSGAPQGLGTGTSPHRRIPLLGECRSSASMADGWHCNVDTQEAKKERLTMWFGGQGEGQVLRVGLNSCHLGRN